MKRRKQCPMASYLNLDDVESLTDKINERAPDIFQVLPDRSQLQVNKYFKKKNEDKSELVCVARNQDVKNVLQIKALERVRPIILFKFITLACIALCRHNAKEQNQFIDMVLFDCQIGIEGLLSVLYYSSRALVDDFEYISRAT